MYLKMYISCKVFYGSKKANAFCCPDLSVLRRNATYRLACLLFLIARCRCLIVNGRVKSVCLLTIVSIFSKQIFTVMLTVLTEVFFTLKNVV